MDRTKLYKECLKKGHEIEITTYDHTGDYCNRCLPVIVAQCTDCDEDILVRPFDSRDYKKVKKFFGNRTAVKTPNRFDKILETLNAVNP